MLNKTNLHIKILYILYLAIGMLLIDASLYGRNSILGSEFSNSLLRNVGIIQHWTMFASGTSSASSIRLKVFNNNLLVKSITLRNTPPIFYTSHNKLLESSLLIFDKNQTLKNYTKHLCNRFANKGNWLLLTVQNYNDKANYCHNIHKFNQTIKRHKQKC